MPSRSPFRRRSGLARGTLIVVATIVGGCAGMAGTIGSSASPTASPVASAAIATDVPATNPASQPALAAPPDAFLSVEGGDPVLGQLGTFTWLQTGSDSPWLHGAGIAVGAGEPVTVSLDPPFGVAGWQARYVPATADDPTGAILLGKGVGTVSLAAPPSGSWTVEVHVTFAEQAGEASYFWRMDVD